MERQQTGVPMDGIFRHNDYLARQFEPVCITYPGDVFNQAWIDRLSAYLGKPVRVYQASSKLKAAMYLLNEGCRVWMSPALDFASPLIDLEMPAVTKVSIIHDVQATKGYYGANNDMNFRRALKGNDVFLYITEGSRERVLEWCDRNNFLLENKTFIPYGCPHRFEELPEPIFAEREEYSSSLHSLAVHKDFPATAHISTQLGCLGHFHVGRLYNMPYEDLVKTMFDYPRVSWFGALPDEFAEKVLLRTGTFICMSRDEGFSMPPMEAILLGIPRVVLSAIPAHVEIYGRYPSVSIIESDEQLGKWYGLPRIDDNARQDLFLRFHPSTLLDPFKSHFNVE
jgi:hypothetical protein